MKEKVNQFESLLKGLIENIEQRFEIEQIDLELFDKIQTETYSEEDGDLKKHAESFRIKIAEFKKDDSFWENDIKSLIELLTEAKAKIQSIREKRNSNASRDKKDIEIGGKDLPNDDIIKLIKQGILNTEMPITKTHKGKTFTGYLTEDGYLEIEINGVSKKRSLRRAAIYAFGSDNPNQWKFWEVTESDGIKQPLENFKKRIVYSR